MDLKDECPGSGQRVYGVIGLSSDFRPVLACPECGALVEVVRIDHRVFARLHPKPAAKTWGEHYMDELREARERILGTDTPEGKRREAFRDRCSKLLDGFSSSPLYLTAVPWGIVADFKKLRQDLAVELDGFLSATPMPQDQGKVLRTALAQRDHAERLVRDLSEERDTARNEAALQKNRSTYLEGLVATAERERDAARETVSEMVDERILIRQTFAANERALISAKEDLAAARKGLEEARLVFEREHKHLTDWWSGKHDRVLAERNTAVRFMEHSQAERDRRNVVLHDLNLPYGRDGFEALVASHQTLTAIDKALGAKAPCRGCGGAETHRIGCKVGGYTTKVQESQRGEEPEEPAQLDRIEALLLDLAEKVMKTPDEGILARAEREDWVGLIRAVAGASMHHDWKVKLGAMADDLEREIRGLSKDPVRLASGDWVRR